MLTRLRLRRLTTHAVELHPVQGQGAGRFRAGKVPHNEDFRLRKVNTQPRLACRGGHGGEQGVSLLEASGRRPTQTDRGREYRLEELLYALECGQSGRAL